MREAARQVQTNQKRVETTRAARAFAERRLEAEQRKFAAGTSTSFIVFQAQRDLAQARNNELRAILDYAQSVVDLETVQEVPLNGGGTQVERRRAAPANSTWPRVLRPDCTPLHVEAGSSDRPTQPVPSRQGLKPEARSL